MLKLIFGVFLLCGLAFGEALTLEQFSMQRDFESAAQRESWTHQWDVTQVGQYSTGYVKPEVTSAQVYHLGEGEKLKPFSIDEFGIQTLRILNQGNCGSCVVFAVIGAFQDSMMLRKLQFPELSPQHLMNCGTGGQCNGSWGEVIASDLVKLQTLHAESDYPYTARSGKCQVKTAERYGKIASFKTIDGSPRSILAALHNGQVPAVGVAADSRFMAYKSGVYSGCGSLQTNHYVKIRAMSCGKAVDAEGNCVFDSNGNLPPGVGTFTVDNSWGTSWGNNGRIEMLITDKSGRRCNNIAGGEENAQIFDIGIPLPPKGPTKFTINRQNVKLEVEVKETAPYSPDQMKQSIEKTLTNAGVK